MSENRYNIVFTGDLLGGTDAAKAREKLGSTFRLSDDQLDNLFSGDPVVVKRDVDLMTATRFQQAFLAAGARAEIETVAPPTAPGLPSQCLAATPSRGPRPTAPWHWPRWAPRWTRSTTAARPATPTPARSAW